ncbi:MAG: PKD domain-containing protein, partial [Bacteroidales bacterium]|nr:PKD domain-containing protein [Bacteroidales bacterium]
YNWSTGATTAAVTVNPASTTTYTVTVTNAAGCTATANATVTVNALPTAAITPASATICAGGSTTLTASGGSSYNWSTGATTAAVTVNPASTTTYTVTVTNAAGCTATANATVTVNALPTAAITPASASICADGSTTLTASGGSSYNWSTGATTAAVTVNPASTTTYTVTVTNAAGCTATANATVTVNALPVVNAGADVSIPFGTNTTLNGLASGGSGFYNFAWDPAALVVNSTNATTATVNLNSTTTFTLTATDQVTGCSSTDQVVVTVTGGPLTINLTATPNIICNGSTSQLIANVSGGSGTYTYNWSSNPNGFSSNISNPIVAPTQTTTYTVTVNDGFNDVVGTITITVNPLPVADAGTDISICEGESANLLASGGDSYLWSTNENTAAITVSPTVTTIYTVTVTSTDGCSATDNVTVIVNPIPVITLTSNTTICEGSSITLTATGGDSYLWSTSENTASIIVTPAITTTYDVTVSNSYGCSTLGSVTVTVNTLPVADAGQDVAICIGNNAVLTANGGVSYEWNTGSNTNSITVSPTTNTTYSVTVTDANGCTNVDDVVVSVNPLPVADAGSDVAICQGQSATLTANGGVSYLWGTNDNTQTITVSPTTTTLYYVTVTDANGCEASDYVTVIVNEVPSVVINVTNTVCGGATGTAEAFVSNGTGNYTYLWDVNAGSQTTALATGLAAGVYSLTVNDGNCSTVAQAEILEDGAPVMSLTASADTICLGQTVTLTATGANDYTWSPATYLSATTGSNVDATPDQTITYTVTGTNGACSATESITITVIPLAQAAFTYTDLGMGQIQFTDASVNADSWTWDFGDGNTDNNQNPMHTYTVDGMYNVQLIVANACGSDTASQNINVIIDNVAVINSELSLSAYPNPNNGKFNLNLSSSYTGKITVTVYDENGRRVVTTDMNKVSSKMQIPMDLKNVSKGVYRITVQMGEKLVYANMVIDRL